MIDSKDAAFLQELIATSDDKRAYTRLYRIYFNPLFQFAFSFVKSKPAAQDIVSEVFLQLWRIRKKLNSVQNLTVYLYTCIRNEALAYLRRQERNQVFRMEEDSLEIESPDDNPEQILITSELLHAMDRAVNQLPPQCRRIFKLIREDGLKYREVAAILDISVKTVEAQIGIAMKKLHDSIQPATPKKNISILKKISLSF